jgi:hypothetical protein
MMLAEQCGNAQSHISGAGYGNANIFLCFNHSFNYYTKGFYVVILIEGEDTTNLLKQQVFSGFLRDFISGEEIYERA